MDEKNQRAAEAAEAAIRLIIRGHHEAPALRGLDARERKCLEILEHGGLASILAPLECDVSEAEVRNELARTFNEARRLLAAGLGPPIQV